MYIFLIVQEKCKKNNKKCEKSRKDAIIYANLLRFRVFLWVYVILFRNYWNREAAVLVFGCGMNDDENKKKVNE